MHRPIALLALSGSLAVAAQSTTVVDLWMPFLGDAEEIHASPPPISVSVVNADSQATTYAVKCLGGTNPDECPTEALTFVQGPSTLAFSTAGQDPSGGAFSEVVQCKAQDQPDTVICSASMAISDGHTAQVRNETITTSGFVTDRIPVTVTAGLEKLSATPGSGVSNSVTNTGMVTATAAASASGSSGSKPTQSASKGAQSSASPSGGNASPTSTSGANAGVLFNVQGAVLVGMGAIIGGLML